MMINVVLAYGDLICSGVIMTILVITHDEVCRKMIRVGLVLVALGMMSQVLVFHGLIHRVSVPIWGLKDLGVWILTMSIVRVLYEEYH